MEQEADVTVNGKYESARMQVIKRDFESLMGAAEAAELLNLHHVTVLRWAREGLLPHLRLGRKVMFRASELDAWCNARYTVGAVRAA